MTPRWRKILKDYTESIVLAFILAIIIRAFIVQSFVIPSGSMLETLQIGDHILVPRFSYSLKIPYTHIALIEFSEPERGDIIVFEYPKDPSEDFIKRVIGTPGDTVEVRNKDVYVNGEKLDEPYVQHTDPNFQTMRDNMAPRTVPKGKYFVMGDNRDESLDSRFWGFVDKSAVVGKAWMIYWSSNGLDNFRWNRIGKIVE